MLVTFFDKYLSQKLFSVFTLPIFLIIFLFMSESDSTTSLFTTSYLAPNDLIVNILLISVDVFGVLTS